MDYFAKEYSTFRSNIPQKKISVSKNVTWIIYDSGPRYIKCPLIFLPPSIGRADTFYYQMNNLSAFGYRVITVDYPVFWSTNDFCHYFLKLLDALELENVHIFGSGMGGFLAQKFTELMRVSKKVSSLILCNSYNDSSIFDKTVIAKTYWALPSILLKQQFKDVLERGAIDRAVLNSLAFMNTSLDSLSQSELASRLTLAHSDDYVRPHILTGLPIMLLQTLDDDMLPASNYEEMCKCYPESRKAELKTGGLFPFLSRWEEICIFLKIHLQQFLNTRYSPMDTMSEMSKLCKDA